MMQQFVYFVQDDAGRIKIGTSTDVAKRMRALQTGQAARLMLLGVVIGGADLERSFHESWKAHRLGGEWFSPAGEILQFIGETAKPLAESEMIAAQRRAAHAEILFRQRLASFLRREHPDSTAEAIQETCGIDAGRVRKWLSGASAPNIAATITLIAKYGLHFVRQVWPHLSERDQYRAFDLARSIQEQSSCDIAGELVAAR